MVAAAPNLAGVLPKSEVGPEGLVLGGAGVPEVHGDVGAPLRVALVVEEGGPVLGVPVEPVVAPGHFRSDVQVVPGAGEEAKVDLLPLDDLCGVARVGIRGAVGLEVALGLAQRKLADHLCDVARFSEHPQAVMWVHQRVRGVALGRPDGVSVLLRAHRPDDGGHGGVQGHGHHFQGHAEVAHDAPGAGTGHIVARFVALDPVGGPSRGQGVAGGGVVGELVHHGGLQRHEVDGRRLLGDLPPDEGASGQGLGLELHVRPVRDGRSQLVLVGAGPVGVHVDFFGRHPERSRGLPDERARAKGLQRGGDADADQPGRAHRVLGFGGQVHDPEAVVLGRVGRIALESHEDSEGGIRIVH
mmetsp:Transcript_85585/g.149455  ORF Transcript_85585/g.149455 Transcript_85585/m.149455 type:complete len:357 (-) Transcript_85585:4924-5994(-)